MAFRFKPEVESSTLPPLVFFSTTRQQTRLVPSRQGWMIELADKESGRVKRYAIKGATVRVGPEHKEHTGMLDIGNRKNWLYSKCLFNGPQELEQQVKLRLGTDDNANQYYDDPQKGRWGGQSERNGRRLSATVAPMKGDDDWFEVRLEIRSMDSSMPLTGKVIFHLHDSFDPAVHDISVEKGSAELELVAWGAFTVGVEADDGKTRLELDLSSLPNVPEAFKSR